MTDQKQEYWCVRGPGPRRTRLNLLNKLTWSVLVKISQHRLCWTVYHADMFGPQTILNKIETDVDLSGFLSTRSSSIHRKPHGTFDCSDKIDWMWAHTLELQETFVPRSLRGDSRSLLQVQLRSSSLCLILLEDFVIIVPVPKDITPPVNPRVHKRYGVCS
jgi:hypothetical protein